MRRTYRLTAAGLLDASDADAAQEALDSIARLLAEGDGELGYDWQLAATAEDELDDAAHRYVQDPDDDDVT